MILVIVFHLGVAGVAIATIISQLISLYSGSPLSVYDGQQLSAPVFQIVHEEILSGTDFPGGDRQECRVRLLIFPMRFCSLL